MTGRLVVKVVRLLVWNVHDQLVVRHSLSGSDAAMLLRRRGEGGCADTAATGMETDEC